MSPNDKLISNINDIINKITFIKALFGELKMEKNEKSNRMDSKK